MTLRKEHRRAAPEDTQELDELLREYVYGKGDTPPPTPAVANSRLDASLRSLADALEDGWDPQFEDPPDTNLRKALHRIADAIDETPPPASKSTESSIRKIDQALQRMASELVQ